MTTCLNCNVTENDKPLLVMKFQENEIFICPQCLPILIHKPANLAEKLPGAEKFGTPAEHHH
jgi:hypothetical protein